MVLCRVKEVNDLMRQTLTDAHFQMHARRQGESPLDAQHHDNSGPHGEDRHRGGRDHLPLPIQP